MKGFAGDEGTMRVRLVDAMRSMPCWSAEVLQSETRTESTEESGSHHNGDRT